MGEWRSAPDQFDLSGDFVHVWRADLDPQPEQIPPLCEALAADEMERAARFHFDRDRQRYMVGRGILRALLGRYLHQPPAMLRFDYTQYGKPILSAPFSSSNLRFNLAHSGGMALFAFVRGRAIGVDVERIRGMSDHAAIAARFFAPGEIAALNALPVEERTAGFFDFWTRKEAYIKAHGLGLSLPLDSFDVSPTPDASRPELAGHPFFKAVDDFLLCDLRPGVGYAAALAVEGGGWTVRCFQWP